MAKGGAIAFVGQGLTRVLSLALQLVLTNFLGARAYGLYSVMVNLLEGVQQLSLFGLNVGIVRFSAPPAASGAKNRLQAILASAWFVCLLSSCGGGCLIFFFSDTLAERLFKDQTMAQHLKWLSFCLPLLTSFALVQAFMRGLQRISAMALMNVIRGSTNLALTFLALRIGLELGGAFCAFVIGVCIALGYGIRGFTNLGISPWRGDLSSARELLSYSLPIFVAILSNFIVARLDVILLGYLRDPEEAGIYRASVAVASMVNFILGSINAAFAPMISELSYQHRKEEMVSLYKRTTRWVISVAVFVCCVILALPREVLGFFGKDFQGGYLVLSVLSIAQLCNASTGSVNVMLQMTGLQKLFLINTVSSALLNLSLSLALIPKMGALGAATAAGLSLVFNNGVGSIELWSIRKIHPWDRKSLIVLTFGLALLMIGIIVKSLSDNFFYTVVIMGLVHVIMLNKIILDKEDRDLMRFFSKLGILKLKKGYISDRAD